ncbi:copper amine oxidase N-terminal domain-containing protein [Paenibacillus nasutitermitis]|uniref:Copper amine oxidase-like N-terminal domain-containing protein n=1 Tax=Paenibacillus nasutitermitis TaxID=1652958 RepID=A0A916Z7G0_9BACL|nr:copper amine oxidase N-terminal domain-containing protein [Paenibacillus nasutitermitis]GGD78779.1 hypothetical protein GCM10010911_41090 [Paenibacillus nasutitermitis]
MKKIVIVLALVSFGLMGYAPAHAAVDYNKRPVEIIVNGKFIPMDVHPIMDNNRLFIPIRSLASLGIHYSYSSSRVTLKNENGEYLKITVGSKVAYKGNQKIQMDQAAKNQDGRVLVPIRFVSEALGYHVEYETLRQMVFVNSDSYKFDQKQITQEDLQAARKAAISLPIQFDFKPLDSSGVHHNYSFPVGRADVYMLLDSRNTTLVNIKDGKATAVGQFAVSDRSHTSGDIPPNFIFDTDPLFEAYHNSNVLFIENRDGTARAIHKDENGKSVELKTNIHVYSDIIQKLPNQQ